MKKTYILTAIILLGFLFGCSRYEDGPCISFRSPTSRILGTWQVEKLLINDIDSTEAYRQKIGCEWEFTDELFYDDGERYKFYYNNCVDDTIRKCLWYFDNYKKNMIWVGTGIDTATNPIGPIGRWGSWDILRLTNDEMHLWINPPQNIIWNVSKETTYYLELKKL